MNIPVPSPPIPGLNFTAIDFETANNYRRSACSLGIARVRDGQIQETRYWLIRPDPFEMGPYQFRVHGIPLHTLADQPSFGELWGEIRPFIDSEKIVAHNISFDESVLEHVLSYYNLDMFYQGSFCTYEGASRCWPRLASHKLNEVSAHLGIELNHHHALSDAVACARLAIEIARLQGATDLHRIRYHNIDSTTYAASAPTPVRNPFANFNYHRQSLPIANLDGLTWSEVDTSAWTWNGKCVVITGELASYPDRGEIARIIERKGGRVVSAISGKTNVVVVGSAPGPSKIEKIKSLMANGNQFHLINQELLEKIV